MSTKPNFFQPQRSRNACVITPSLLSLMVMLILTSTLLTITACGKNEEATRELRQFVNSSLASYQISEIQALINKRADINVRQSSEVGFTLLHHAAANGDAKLVQFLVKNGANLYDDPSFLKDHAPIMMAIRGYERDHPYTPQPPEGGSDSPEEKLEVVKVLVNAGVQIGPEELAAAGLMGYKRLVVFFSLLV